MRRQLAAACWIWLAAFQITHLRTGLTGVADALAGLVAIYCALDNLRPRPIGPESGR